MNGLDLLLSATGQDDGKNGPNGVGKKGLATVSNSNGNGVSKPVVQKNGSSTAPAPTSTQAQTQTQTQTQMKSLGSEGKGSLAHARSNGLNGSTGLVGKPIAQSTTTTITPSSTSTSTTTRPIPNTLSASVPVTRPTLSHGYVTTSVIPTTANRTNGQPSVQGERGREPVLFDFRTTDRKVGTNGQSANGTISNGTSGVSLLSQGLKVGGPSKSSSSPVMVPTTVGGSSSSTATPPTSATGRAFPPTTATVNNTILRRTSTSGGKSGLYSPMPAPRMRPRAMSMQMKIKGEILPNGAGSDEDEDFDMNDEDEGMMMIDVADEDGNSTRKAVPLGTGSGGIKGKRKGMVFRCESCAKVYRHPSCLSKHRWEHSPHWASSSKLLLSKHQQVQLLEAATILVHLDPGNPAGQGKSLPEDKSLWPAAVSPAFRGNIKLPSRGYSPAAKSPYTTAASLPGSAPGNSHIRKTSPTGSSSSTESSDRAHSVDADSGYASARPGDLQQQGRRPSQLGRGSISSPLGQSVGSNGQGSLPDFAGFHISSPRRYPLGTTPTNGSLGTNGKPSSVGGFGHAYSYGSSHGTARGHGSLLFSPTYSPALGLPQSSLRSGTFLERHDEDSAEEDEDDDNDHRGSSNERTNGGFAGRAGVNGSRGMSMDRQSPDEGDMEWEANDMEM